MGAYKKTTDQLCEFVDRTGGCDSKFISADFTSNDSSQVMDVGMFEIRWLLHFGAPRWVTAFLLQARCFSATNYTYGVRVRITNQLATGAQSTTFRNSMWNATIMRAFVDSLGLKARALVLGDDGLISVQTNLTTRVLARQYRYISKLACMLVKVSVSRTVEGLNFLSRFFWRLPTGLVLVPLLGKAIARFNVCPSPHIPRDEYMAGKCLSYSYEFRSFPALSGLFFCKYESIGASRLSLDSLGWHTKGVFLDLGYTGVLRAISLGVHRGDVFDFTPIVHRLYGLTAVDYYQFLFRVLFGTENLDAMALSCLTSEWMGG